MLHLTKVYSDKNGSWRNVMKAPQIWLEPPHDKTNKMACAPTEDSDQPGHPPSLISVFAVHMKKAWVLSYPLSAQWRLWSDWADAQADQSLQWAHIPFCLMRRFITIISGAERSSIPPLFRWGTDRLSLPAWYTLYQPQQLHQKVWRANFVITR